MRNFVSADKDNWDLSAEQKLILFQTQKCGFFGPPDARWRAALGFQPRAAECRAERYLICGLKFIG
jgi:hypothetical protein